MIALYDPRRGQDLGTFNAVDLQRIHWREAAGVAEDELRRFLGLTDEWDVVLYDRATHALEAAIGSLSPIRVILPANTYRAADDAALLAGKDPEFVDSPLGVVDPDRQAITVPTPLWGQEPWFTDDVGQMVVLDCAHVCYENMFRELPPPAPDRFWCAVLSFFPTKPCGAFGGGALIISRQFSSELRRHAWPIDAAWTCAFDYPATVQSVAIRRRLEWEKTEDAQRYWDEQQTQYQDLLNWLRSEGFAPILVTAPIRPHLLPVHYDEQLEQLCKNARIEYGRHYPTLPYCAEHPFLTIPFWTPEVVARLQAQFASHSPSFR